MTDDITIKQGATFSLVIKYSQPRLDVATITGITKSGQATVSAAGHGIPTDWLVWIVGVEGMLKINHQPSELKDTAAAYYAYLVDANTVQLDLDTTRFGDYVSGGELLFHPPVNLTGYTARMQIRESLESTTVLHSMTTDPSGGIVLGGTAGTVTLSIPATTTAGFTFDCAVYDLELISSTGVVTAVATGSVILTKEVTR